MGGVGHRGAIARCRAPRRGARPTGLRAERVSDDELEVPGATAEVVGRAAAEEGVVVLGLSERLRSLEDAFFALTGQDS